jgi:hypothetical protein
VIDRHRFALALLAGVVLVATAGCAPLASPTGSPPPPATPRYTGPPVLGLDWGRAASVERPVNFDATLPPGGGNRTHPILRIPGQAIVADVAGLPTGGFVSVGYVPPDWTPAAWTSPDGQTWSIHSLGSTGFTFAVAVASGGNGTTVAVGRSGSLPVAWTSTDGSSWEQRPVPATGPGRVAERMTSVVAGGPGFVAGGSAGPELSDRHARFWTSIDGATWQAVADEPDAFANAEVRDIVKVDDGLVAVGVVGDAQHPTGAVAWTSKDGTEWTRVDDPAFAGGVAVAVTFAPFGRLVAVGSDLDRKEAVAWTSTDGRTWQRAPKEPSRLYAGFVWMTDVAAVGDSVIAVGDDQGLQRGTAESWVSTDGLHWQQSRTAPVQEQGEFYAIAPGGPGAIATGSFGAPDSYVPQVWLTPAR